MLKPRLSFRFSVIAVWRDNHVKSKITNEIFLKLLSVALVRIKSKVYIAAPVFIAYCNILSTCPHITSSGSPESGRLKSIAFSNLSGGKKFTIFSWRLFDLSKWWISLLTTSYINLCLTSSFSNKSKFDQSFVRILTEIFVQKCYVKKVLKFREIHLCQSLLFNKVATSLRPATLSKKSSGTDVFLWISWNF